VATIRVGDDEVTRDGDRLVVVAARANPDWEVRKARKLQIEFRDGLYFPAEERALKDGRVRYVLQPWPERSADMPGPRLTYDAEYVRQRDTAVRRVVAGEIASPLLWCLAPLVGLLPSRTKAGLHHRLGMNQTTATRWSLYLEGAVAMLVGVYMTIAVFVLGLSGSAIFPGVAMVGMEMTTLVLVVDIVLRTGRLLRGSSAQWGFYEWLYGPILGWVKRLVVKEG